MPKREQPLASPVRKLPARKSSNRSSGLANLAPAPTAYLRQVAPHGIIESDYEDVCRQLNESGRASVVIPPLGMFFQIA